MVEHEGIDRSLGLFDRRINAKDRSLLSSHVMGLP
jgi:hypothetical protein